MPRTIACLSAMLLFTLGCQQPTSPAMGIFAGDDAASAFERKRNERTAARLANTEMTLADRPHRFADAIDEVRRKTGATIFVNWAALEAAGIEPDMSVHLTVGQHPADHILKWLLQEAGAGSAMEPFSYVIRDGIVVISTKRDVQRETETRIYDVRDLIEPIPTLAGALGFDGDEMTIKIYLPRRELPPTLFEGEELPPRHDRRRAIETITSLIQDHVGVQSDWQAYGGEISSIAEFDGDLLITTTPEGHTQLAQFLGALRASRAKAQQRFEQQVARARSAGVADLAATLQRLERKFDEFNTQYESRAKGK